jgi:ELWxxDGT repeat protein
MLPARSLCHHAHAACVLSLVALAACQPPSLDPIVHEDEQAVTAAQKISELSTDVLNDLSAPDGYQVVNGQMMFFSRAGQPLAGLGLFRSDGTAAGTQLVRDLAPVVGLGHAAPYLVVLNNRGYWSQDGALWVTDGTAAGTTQVAAFGPSTSFDPTDPVVYGGALYFGAGGSMYRSDGTPAGTQILVASVGPSGRWQEMGGKLYFGCEIAPAGQELCVTDGTAAGTSMVKEIFPGIQSGEPIFLGVAGTRLVFSAVNDPQFFARGLWSTDGTAAGTVELVRPPGGGFQDAIDRNADPAAILAGRAYLPCFTTLAGFELCKTDGTVAGTAVLDLVPGSGSLGPFNVVVLGARLVFVASTTATGVELWSSNGTVAGTQMIIDLLPGPSSSMTGLLIPFRGAVYFGGKAALGDPSELWKTDGTAAGTTRVARIQPPGTPERFPLFLGETGALGTQLFFSADDGTTSIEPWVTDGTAAGTHLVKDLAPTRTRADVGETHAYHGAHYLSVDGGLARRLWRTDGTAAGTAVFQNGLISGLTGVDHWLYYTADTSGRNAVWKSDGTVAGSAKLVEVGTARELQAFGKRLVFAGSTPNLSVGLWQSDGTPAGTALVDPFVVNARHLGVANGRIWLTALDGGLGNELWTSDGTSAGTAAVKDLRAGFGSSEPSDFVALNGQTLFTATDDASGGELWKTDGTADGTVRIADLNPGALGSGPGHLLAWNGMVLFTATSAGQAGLWRTDGTTAGTTLVKPVTTAFDVRFVPWGNFVFFAATDAQGTELWRTDGTPAGTVLVSDVYAGPLSSNPSLLALAGPDGPLVFAAEEPLAGREVWQLAQPLGTPALVADLAPGPQSSRPTSIGVQGSSLVVVADAGTGYAVWRIDGVGPDATAPVVTCADITVMTTNSQGTAVTFPLTAIDNSGHAPTVTADRASGEIFPLGTTRVNVTATDGSNNTSRCSFAIQVTLQAAMPDAGPNDLPDAGPDAKPDAGNGEVPSGGGAGGCGCGAGSNAGSANLLAFALVALVLRRRPRARR